MSSIDNRIVNMQFNNRGFESGVATTLNSLKKLNESLKMKDSSKGLTDINSSLNKVNNSGLSGLSRGVEAITSRFSTLGFIGTTALMNITNKAVNAGAALTKSLTIEPITTGFSEYETKMGSIQTILTNTAHAGTTLKDVTKTLDELNLYADKTIYNFAEMTKNIGTFTAAGVDLDTSTAAIKGIANLAAASGSTSQQASTAMYQLSQALAAGKVSLMDWNSVVNAGMGGKLFQDSLIRTSEVLGTGAESMIKKYGSFRESLTKGEWLTTEVLTETLKQLSGAYTEADLIAQGFSKSQAKEIVQLAKNATAAATEVKTVTQLIDTMKESVQSGWAQSWEYIIGDKDEATKTLTAISDAFNNIIEPSTKARNEMLKIWNDTGGRDAAIKGLSNIFTSLGKVLGSVGKAFREVFPAMTGEKLVAITKSFEKLTEKIKISDKTAAKIKDTFKGIFSVFDLVKNAVVSVFKAFAPATGIFGGVTNGLLNVTSSAGKFLTAINDCVKSSGIFDKIAGGISNAIIGIGTGFGNAGKLIGEFVKSLASLNFKPIFDFISQIGGGFGKGIGDMLSGVGKAIGNLNINTILGAVAALAGKGVFDKLGGIFDSVTNSIKGFDNIGKNISNVIKSTTDALKAMSTDIKAGALIKIAGAVAILSLSLSALASIDQASLETALMGLTALFVELVGTMAILTKITSGKGKGGILSGLFGNNLNGTAASMLLISGAILVLSAAVKNLSSLNPKEVMTGLAGIAGSLLALVGAVKLLDGVKGHLVKAGAGMILMATALNIMGSAVDKFSKINPNNMVVGLMSIAVVLLELAAFMKITDFSGIGISSSTGILIVAGALVVLQNAVDKFGNMKLGSLTQGIVAIGGLLTVIAGFSRLSASATKMLGISVSLIAIGGALHVLSSAVRSMAGMQWDDMARGLTTMATSLLILTAAVKLMSGSGLMAVGAGLIIASSGLLIMASALKSLAEMSWEEMGRGLVALAGGLVVLGAAAAVMQGMIVGAGALLVLAGAMAILTPQLIAMSNLSWKEIGAGLTMLAGALAILGVAGAAATFIGPGLLMLGGAVALLGVGCLAAAAGVTMFAAGLASLAAVGAAGGFALIEILRQLINLLPQLGTKLGECLVNMAKAIGDGIPVIADSFGKMLEGILKAFVDYTPRILELGVQLIELLCNALIESGPKLIQVAVDLVVMLAESLVNAADQLIAAGVTLVIKLLEGLANKVGEIIQAGIDLGIALIEGLADGITNNQERVEAAIEKLGEALIDAFMSLLGIHSPSTVFNELGVNVIEGLIQGIGSKVGDVISKIQDLGTKMINTVKTKVGEFLSAGSSLITSLAKGVSSKASSVLTSIKTIVSNGVKSIKSRVGEFLSAGSNLLQNLINGIKSKASSVSSAIKSAITSAKSAASGMVGQFKSIGSNIITGLSNGIKSMASTVASSAKSVVQGAVNAAKKALKINSPSRVFMQIGDYTVQGFVKGLEDNAVSVDDSATSLARRAIDGVSNSIASISDTLNGQIDDTITIRPVMDLSDVNGGVKTIRDLMSDNNQFAINANTTSAITRSIGRVQNRPNNDDIISALKDLQSSMTTDRGNTYQINGITYDDGSSIKQAVESLVRAAKIERRV